MFFKFNIQEWSMPNRRPTLDKFVGCKQKHNTFLTIPQWVWSGREHKKLTCGKQITICRGGPKKNHNMILWQMECFQLKYQTYFLVKFAADIWAWYYMCTLIFLSTIYIHRCLIPCTLLHEKLCGLVLPSLRTVNSITWLIHIWHLVSVLHAISMHTG